MPKNLKFLAIPFYELYENAQAYGPQLAALPHYLSRYRFEYVDDGGNVVAEMPGGPQQPGARTSRDDVRYASHEDTSMGNGDEHADENGDENINGNDNGNGNGEAAN